MALCTCLVFLVAWIIAIFAVPGNQSENTGDWSLEQRVASLENIVAKQDSLLEQQERVIEELMVEKQQSWLERQRLRRDMAELQRRVIFIQSSFSSHPKLGGHPTSAIRESLKSQFYSKTESASNETQHHAVLARSDDADPLQAVVSQLAERVDDVSARLQSLKNEVSATIPEAAMSVFVRWGSSGCPGSSALIYTGVLGGSIYNSPGAAVDYLCLPISHVVLEDSSTPYNAHLFGGEYETYDAHMNTDPLCAVCRSPRPTNIMVPATNQCPAGWSLEYGGYLMAGYPDHTAASQFVCVDSALEERLGSEQDLNGKLLYYTVTNCGSLPCPPYADGKKVPCVVCSK